MLTHCFLGAQKRRMQPERYATLGLKFFKKYVKKHLTKLKNTHIMCKRYSNEEYNIGNG
jgi:hypothetical protein